MFDLDSFVLDMDGVLWHGSRPSPGMVEFFDRMRLRGMGYVLATNNSSRTVEQYVEKLANMGVQVSPKEVITSAYATADYLLTITKPGAKVFAVGEIGLVTALESRGFLLTEDGAEFVVVGLDRSFSYEKMAQALELIQKGAQYIGTNSDLTFPAADAIRPGAGAMLAGISAASGVEPLIIGKPEPLMFQLALARLGTAPERTAMVGDRLETDILGGLNAGLRTILLLSGVTDRELLANSSIRPEWVLEDIRALTAALS